jgi:hypothetical protein
VNLDNSETCDAASGTRGIASTAGPVSWVFIGDILPLVDAPRPRLSRARTAFASLLLVESNQGSPTGWCPPMRGDTLPAISRDLPALALVGLATESYQEITIVK